MTHISNKCVKYRKYDTSYLHMRTNLNVILRTFKQSF